MLPRFLIPTIGVVFLAGFLVGCASSSSDEHLQVQANPGSDTQTIEWHSDELMATGGDLVLNQLNWPHRV